MIRLTPNRRRRHRAVLALVALGTAALISSPAAADDPKAGDAGVDTSLPLTESAVVVKGRGPFSDLEVTVTQTENLVNQAISVNWTGGVTTTRGASRYHRDYLQIMQCWGEDDGTNPANPGPPPEQCVFGATDAVYGGRNQGLFPAGGLALERVISRDFFESFDPNAGYYDTRTKFVWRPFRAVDGVVVNEHYDPTFDPSIVGGSYWLNPYFNSITTNEIAGGRTGVNGKGAELFEVQTGLESSGLGCGQESQPVPGGGTKRPRCWLVIVPRGDPTVENAGTPYTAQQGVFTSPLAPAAWKNRIAVPLGFTPIESSCDIGAEPRRISGNELPVPAVSSWQQKLCTTPGLPPYAYGTVGDATARQQLTSNLPGGPGMVVVSRPLDATLTNPTNPVVYAPVTLSATVIGFNVERTPAPGVDSGEEDLRSVRVAELNLTPRLVAKLLTQSYVLQTSIKGAPHYDWVKENPKHLALDPDFLRFNPEFKLLEIANGKNFGGLVMPARDSDGARQLWEWVLADPEAKEWLGGTKDPWGMQVNPAYSTDPAVNTNGQAFGDPVPEQFPKSDPYCYQAPPQGVGDAVTPPPLCGTDWLPYTQSLRDAARLTRAADDGAKTTQDFFAISADKVYRSDGPQSLGSRTVLSVTDSASAFQYGVQTARLSRAGDDGDARRFIAPDEAGLTAGVAAMVAKEGSPVLEPVPTTASTTAYPLTVLTYAAVTPLSQDDAARAQYASFLDYAAGDGQVLGRELGQLPPGYAPLPAALRAQTAAAAKQVREMKAVEEAAAPVETSSTETVSPVFGGDAIISPDGFTSTPLSSFPLAVQEAVAADFGSTPTIDTPATTPASSGLMTPVLALAGNRFVLPGLGAVALASAAGTVEITKRPRRARVAVTPPVDGGDV